MPIGQGSQTVNEAWDVGNLSLMSNALVSRGGPDKVLEIASVLQTTLDVDQLIAVFSRQIQALVPHSSIRYENKAIDLAVMAGRPEKSSCTYQLVVAAQTLGQVTVTRRKKFTEDETLLLEHLLCCLVYPLRNAIMYKIALTAALRDPLTGVNNRTAMNSALIRETELARRHGTPLSLIALDIDRFKDINDRHGHLAGDHVLKNVAEAIADCTRSSDILFRSGGEEFVVLLSNTGRDGALQLAERIRQTIEATEYDYANAVLSVTASLGVSCFSKGDDSERLFERADMALYAAKSAGRNCVKFVE